MGKTALDSPFEVQMARSLSHLRGQDLFRLFDSESRRAPAFRGSV